MTEAETRLAERLEDLAPNCTPDDDTKNANVRALVDRLMDEAHDELDREGKGGCIGIAVDAIAQAAALLDLLGDRLRRLDVSADRDRLEAADVQG